MNPRRGWNRPSLVLVGLAAVGLAIAIAFRLAGADGGGDLADIISLPLTAASLLIALIGLFVRPQVQRSAADNAGRLSVAVRAERGRLRRRLLYGQESGLDVGFAVARSTDLVRWQQDGGPAEGTLSDIHGYYLELDRGRLVIVGAAGAGKTVLAIELLLGLIDWWWDDRGQPRPGRPGARVPVMVSLPSWDHGDTEVTDEELAARLYQWIIDQIVHTYQLDRQVAAELVTSGWVLPVLDGLDEMDEDQLNPVRAAAVLRAVNVAAGKRLPAVVLTCRQEEYQALVDYAGDPVRGATTVAVRPLTAAQVGTAIEAVYDGVPLRWQPVVDELRRSPDGHLAQALSTPWRLFLAITVYSNRGSQPQELIGLPADQLVDHLLDAFLPQVRKQLPVRPPATDAQVRDWLGLLAGQLRRRSGDGAGSDLYLDRLWLVAGQRLPRVLHCLLIFVVLGVPAAVAVELTGGPVEVLTGLIRMFTERDREYLNAVVPTMAVLVALVNPFVAWEVNIPLGRIDLSPLRSRPGWSRVLRAVLEQTRNLVLFPIIMSVGVGLLFKPWTGLFFGIGATVTMVLYVLGLGLLHGSTEYPQWLREPSDLIRGELRHGAVTAAVFAVLLVLPAMLISDPVVGLAFGVICGAWALNNAAAGLRYLIAVAIVSARGQLPRRLGVFLDWAHQAGVLRLSGIACQFRHVELQRWLLRPQVDNADPDLGQQLAGQRQAEADHA